MKQNLAVAFLFILLSSCASTPKADVAALMATLTAADTAALAYVNLPTCGKTTEKLCSSPPIVKSIGKAAGAAYTAVKAAEASMSSTDILKAQIAVAALQSIVNSTIGE